MKRYGGIVTAVERLLDDTTDIYVNGHFDGRGSEIVSLADDHPCRQALPDDLETLIGKRVLILMTPPSEQSSPTVESITVV